MFSAIERFLGKGRLLGDHGDAVGKGVDWAAEGHARAPYGNDPLVGLKLPREDVEHGGFAGAVLAHEGMDDPGLLKDHSGITQGVNAAEPFVETRQA